MVKQASAMFRRHARSFSMKSKLMSTADAVQWIKNGDTVTISGFVSQGGPEQILAALGKRYYETKTPNNLTIVVGGAVGDGKTKGVNHLAQEGMLKRVVGAHFGFVPDIARFCQTGKVEAYSLPLGAVSRMLRAAATRSPGHITTVGFGTLVDPKMGGGKMNKITTEDLVEEIEVYGQKYLIYKAIPINVAIIRGTTADTQGNITLDRESLYADNLVQAMAARASGGKVIAQVSRMAVAGTLDPRKVRIPGTLVDGVVLADPASHHMSYLTEYSAGHAGEVQVPITAHMKLNKRKVIARRALREVRAGDVVNLGVGLPEGVAAVAEEEGVRDRFTLTTEPGVHGGVGASGLDFGAAVNYHALIEMNQQFDFYNGGGLDVCVLGMLQVDPCGHVNVTRAGNLVKGPGGFIDISQSTQRVNLVGTFTASGLEVEIRDGRLRIVKEGRVRKFVRSIPEITFSATEALARGQHVRYITERCVFQLTPEGLELIEVAPGIDVQTQVLDLMDFAPIMKRPPRLMDPAIFGRGRMGLREKVFEVSVESRIHFHETSGTLYFNLREFNITRHDQVAQLEAAVEAFFQQRPDLAGRVPCFASYDGFDCCEALAEEYASTVEGLRRFFTKSRAVAGTEGFCRRGLGARLGVEVLERFSAGEVVELLRCAGLDVSEGEAAELCKAEAAERAGAGGVAAGEGLPCDWFQSVLDRAAAATRVGGCRIRA